MKQYFETERLIIRPWQKSDGESLFTLRSNPDVMRYFPNLMSRGETEGMLQRLMSLQEIGYAFSPVIEKHTHRFTGFVGIADVNFEADFTPAVEIGWSLLPEFWGKGYATEAANGWLERAFNHHGISELLSFAVVANKPSHKVMERIGMKRDHDRDFDHPRVPKDKPELIRHWTWSLCAKDWNSQ